jgi:hypothetical protein
VRRPSGRTERRLLSDPGVWDGLLTDPRDEDGRPDDEQSSVQVSVPSEWLRAAEADLIDSAGATPAAGRVVAMSDVVVLAVSAQSPLSLAERQFLTAEVLDRRTPHVLIAVTGTDVLAEGDAADVIEWISDQAAALSAGVRVVSAAEAVETLRDRIAGLCHDPGLARLRDRRLARQVAVACAGIEAAAEAAADRIRADEQDRHAAAARLKDRIADGDLIWQQLHLDVEDRRLRFAAELRESATRATADILGALDVELRRTTDVKRWWEYEQPLRMRQELGAMAQRLEAQTRETVTRDLHWLDDQVARRFGRDQSSPVEVRLIPLAAGKAAAPELDDIRRRRTITRLGTAAGGIVGAAFAVLSGIGAPAVATIGTSFVAGWLTERDADRRLDEQRAVLQRKLQVVLNGTLTRFEADLDDNTTAAYRSAFEAMRTSRSAWRTAALAALAESGDPADDITRWTGVAARIGDVSRQLSHLDETDQEEGE